MNNKRLAILGCRGIPAQHGGFETFAERFAIYLQQKGWHVTVYCQEEGNGKIYKDKWRGIYCVHIPVSHAGARGSVIFDWKSTLHAISQKHRLVLTLGYNTAIFCIFYRLAGLVNIINMDGIEWRRDKWNFGQRVWLYINERLGAWLGNHLVADHPEIKKHLAQLVSSSKISMIPYCADIVQTADVSLLAPYDLKQNKYALIVARPEKENLILEIVRAFSQVKRGIPLVILGDYSPNSNEFHKKVFDVAGSEVKFVGAIYDKDEVQALRFFARS